MNVEILIPLGAMAMVVLIVWLRTNMRREAKERQAEILRQVVDKFSTGEAFAEALRGPEGSKLAEALALDETAQQARPKKMWLGLSIPALIMSCLGLGFVALAAIVDRGFVIAGISVGSIGFGLLVATYFAWRIERKEGDDSGPDRRFEAEFAPGSGESAVDPH